MNKTKIARIELALRLHSNYLGEKPINGEYLEIMDKEAVGYLGSLSQKVSKLLNEYYKTVGVLNLDEALLRLLEIDKSK